LIALLQRVTEASVSVDGQVIASIGRGILALIGVERGDGEAEADRLAEKIIAYRIFPDDAGKMNRSLKDIGGELLAVPQFTLVADTNSGTRPSFSSGAPPAEGSRPGNARFFADAQNDMHVRIACATLSIARRHSPRNKLTLIALTFSSPVPLPAHEL